MRRSTAAATVVLTAWAAVGCGPTLVWHGHTPDRATPIQIIEDARGQSVRVGPRKFARFDAVSVESLAFSEENSRIAFAARDEDQWIVVVDGETEPLRWDAVTALTFSPDGENFAYAAWNEGRGWRIVRNGAVGRVEMTVIYDATLRFDRTGQHLAYVGRRGDCASVVVDDDPGPCFSAIADLEIAPSAARFSWAYLAEDDGVARADIEDRPGAGWRRAGYLTASDGAVPRYAFKALGDAGWVAVLDGEPGEPHRDVHSLTFSPNGDQFAYVAVDDEQARAVIDGTPGEPFDEIVRDSLVFGVDGEVAYIAYRGDETFVVRGDDAGESYFDTGQPTFDRTGQHLAYAAFFDDDTARVVVDGERVGPRVLWVGDPVWSPVGGRVAAALRASDGMAIYVYDIDSGEAELHGFDAVMEGTLTWNDAGVWGAIVGDASRKALWITVEGEARRPFDIDEFSAALARRPITFGAPASTRWLNEWVAAEITLATQQVPDPAGSPTALPD